MPDTSPAIRRALVLGAAGFVGSHVVRTLLDRGVAVTALLRGQPGDSEFAFRPLMQQVKVVRGPVEDTFKLAQTIATHEADVIFQCAAGATVSTTHALTHSAIAAGAMGDRRPPVFVPLRAADNSIRVKYQALGPSRSNVAFLRLPDLFGPGQTNLYRWPQTLFAAAARGEPLTPPSREIAVCDAATAAGAMVEIALGSATPFPATGLWIDVPPMASSRELMDAVKNEVGPRLFGDDSPLQDAVRATLEWHRSQSKAPTASLRAAA